MICSFDGRLLSVGEVLGEQLLDVMSSPPSPPEFARGRRRYRFVTRRDPAPLIGSMV
jgi:hypothetical protein